MPSSADNSTPGQDLAALPADRPLTVPLLIRGSFDNSLFGTLVGISGLLFLGGCFGLIRAPQFPPDARVLVARPGDGRSRRWPSACGCDSGGGGSRSPSPGSSCPDRIAASTATIRSSASARPPTLAPIIPSSARSFWRLPPTRASSRSTVITPSEGQRRSGGGVLRAAHGRHRPADRRRVGAWRRAARRRLAAGRLRASRRRQATPF